MPTPVEQALITLVPSFNVLPTELVQLASALLVQSKSKASNLKPDEEIGRIYACANIACERYVRHRLFRLDASNDHLQLENPSRTRKARSKTTSPTTSLQEALYLPRPIPLYTSHTANTTTDRRARQS